MSIAETQRALKVRGPGKIDLATSCLVPQIGADEVLVRVICVAVNPFDGKRADTSPSPGATLGCDFSGEVIAIGKAVKRTYSIGGRVCGCVFGNNPDTPDNGAFSEYVAVPGDLVFQIPPRMSFQAAATLGVGLSTVGLALYHVLKLPLPRSLACEPRFILVYGGGTATGTLAIQMLCLSGLIPITTCSPRNFGLVKSLGAAEAFDYHSVTCGTDIRVFTKDSMEYAFDCITDIESMKICYTAIGSKGGEYVALDPFPIRGHTRRCVKPSWIITSSMINKPINWQRPLQGQTKPKDRKFAEDWYNIAQGLLDNGAIVPHPHEERTGGLEAVLDGVDSVRKGKISGTKLVYRIAIESES